MTKTCCLTIGLIMMIGLFAPLWGSESANRPPVFTPIARQYVNEGDQLQVQVIATDPDGGLVNLAVVARPLGATFIDYGNGRGLFTWRPDFVGPNSSHGSPFEITFWAGDGVKSSLLSVPVVVTDKNRAPEIVSPDTVLAVAGEMVSFEMEALDPDFDLVNWKTLTVPSGAEIDPDGACHFHWDTQYRDSGFYHIRVAATDLSGASDTADVVLRVAAADIYVLTVDTTSGYSGEMVSAKINLTNLVPITGFELLFNYDVSALSLISISPVGTRASGFEYFSYVLNYRGIQGDVRVIGVADVNIGGITPPLTAGDGPIVSLTFFISSDLNLAGFSIPVSFAFRDLLTGNDNTLTDTLGNKIPQSAITYYGGYVRVKKSSTGSLGDINLNGVALEIGDAVYFTNYFINPRQYPLEPAARANSDVNKDGLPATVADLVYLINAMVNGTIVSKPRYDASPVTVYASAEGEDLAVYYEAADRLGAVAITMEGETALPEGMEFESRLEESGLECKGQVDGNVIRLLVYSSRGLALPSGKNSLINLKNISGLRIKEVQSSDAAGFPVETITRDGIASIVPDGYVLHQNRPNPFNPRTEIQFELPHDGEATLAVYNILGQEVRTLAAGHLPAGRHVVIWDGNNAAGKAVPSGIYMYRLQTADYSAQKKMLLLK